ncbi:MAG: hypothetical protein LAN64_18050 [Acidobacteriia bacterium]|nr:hypothetical protein [Terriglobia bacterium]
MNTKHAFLVVILMLALPLFALAQEPDQPGQVWGDYTVHQSIELGGHIVGVGGNPQMYDTFVNLASGPRLLSQELSMQSRTHQSVLFDNLYLSSFGFGGEPESLARLRIQKSKVYNFVGLYRRDKNYFDYDLFANPLNLNAGITTCGVGCTNAFTPSALPWFNNSPHLQATTRNMGDFSLTLLPESAVSVRLGYARNATYGRVDTSLEAPIRTILTEDSQWRSDRYQFGVDLKLLPRTNLSLDVFFEHDKNDIGFLDGNVLYALGNATGPTVDIGVLLPPLSGTLPSCAGAGTPQTIHTGNIFIINSGCNAVLVNSGPGGPYFKRGHLRTDIPTGQIALQSNYFRKLDLTASATYSSASSDFLNFNEFMHGSTATLNSGSPNTDRVSANADLGVTLHLTKHLSISDKFRWLNWREPGAFTNTAFNCVLASGAALAGPTGFPAGAVTLTALRNPCNSDILTLTGVTASGNATSGSYQAITSYNSILGEDSYFNIVKLNWQPSRRLGGYIGYRYGHRKVRDGNLGVGVYNQVTTNFANNGTGAVPTTPTVTTSVGAVDKEEINLHTGLLGVAVRPVDAWRINGDLEFLYADNSFTLITPRHQQRVRVYSNYKLNRWMSLNGGLHFVETRNGFAAGDTVENLSGTIAANVGGPLFPATFTSAAYGHKDHWRYYTFGTSINPNSKFTFDLGWTLLDQDIKSATCLPLSGTGGVFGGTVTAPAPCNNAATARAFLQDFQESTNSAYTNIAYRPTKRFTLSLGYEVTQDNGHTNWRRLDNGTNLQVVGDIFGNSPPLAGNPISPCPLGSAGAAVGCIFPGPFPDQPLGPQAINWHKGSAGLAFEVVKGVEFKGLWSYYDYNGKDHSPALALLTVTSRRDFHAHVGTLSLRYSF